MTLITGIAVVLIARYFIVFVGEITGVVVFMAIDTTKDRKISRRGMTFHALIPFIVVFSTVNGKPHLVMVKIGRRPGSSRMAILASSRKAGSHMIGIVGAVEI